MCSYIKKSIPYRIIRATNSCRQALMNGFTTIRHLGTEDAGYADADLKKAFMLNPNLRYLKKPYNTEYKLPMEQILAATIGICPRQKILNILFNMV